MRLPLTFGTLAIVALAATTVRADDDGIGRIDHGVPSANPRVGTPATRIDRDFELKLLATGTDPLENPSGIITKFGRLNDGGGGDHQGSGTEPDENLYLKVEHNPGGPDGHFDYGRHFLFQGHENGGGRAYVTRINLDVPRGNRHRITLLTPVDATTGLTGFSSIDGSTYDPFTNTLLFTQELSSGGNGTGKVIQISVNWPPQINTLEAFLGLGGYEGIHPDDQGNLYLVEDIGGPRPGGVGPGGVPLNAAAQPNSFVYRYVPNNPHRIEDGGLLQALQVTINGQPVTFHAGDPAGDILSDAQLQLHTLGSSWPVKWVTIHTSHAGDTASFSATAAAKAAGATPFKRPENLTWLPGSGFRTFFFSPTGDTDAPTSQVPALAARGSWGSLFRVDLRDDDHHSRARPSHDDGRISIFFLGDQTHNSFDNIAMADENTLLAAEDRGDTLHSQLNTLDSVWAFDVKSRRPRPVRFIALGRDASSVANGEDNEPTGLFVSNGSARQNELLGTRAGLDDARAFVTQQHGDNNVFEIVNNKQKSAKK